MDYLKNLVLKYKIKLYIVSQKKIKMYQPYCKKTEVNYYCKTCVYLAYCRQKFGEVNKLSEDTKIEYACVNLNLDEAKKDHQGKPRYDLIPIEPLEELGKVYASGCIKHGENNWSKGTTWRKMIRPLLGHLFDWIMGKERDEETKCHLLAQVMFYCCTLIVYQKHNIGIDDRLSFKRGDDK